jgi:aspartyl-tRNA(Asn)/glutamyl-tRNA(Gln) amidotransferase subunit B
MRSKEEANDYRYFPDPDLLPVIIDDELIESLRAELPELPDARTKRLTLDYNLSDSMSEELTSTPEIADYFEDAAKAAPNVPAKKIGNLIQRELGAALNREGLRIEDSKVPPSMIASLAQKIEDNTVSASAANIVFDELWKVGGSSSIDNIIEKNGLKQISDTNTIEMMVDEVITNNPEQVMQFKNGKEKVIGFLVGQVMKTSKGKANPQNVNQILRDKLKSP